MKLSPIALIAGGALLLAGAAVAASRDAHVLDVALPDGSVAHIAYVGKVAPTVRIDAPAAIPGLDADMTPAAPDAIFAAMAREQAAMARQVAEMQRAALHAPAITGAPGVVVTSTGRAPAGLFHYSYVSTSTGTDGCTRTVEYSSDGTQAQPKVTQTSAGACAKADAAKPAPAAAPAQQAPAPGKPI